MIKLRFPLWLCVCLVAGCSKSAPVITFSELEHEGGAQAGILRHRFTFRNEGSAILEIRQVSSSCGCTVAEVGKTHLDPGDTSSIEATMQVLRQRRRSFVYVQTNDPARPEVILSLRASGPFPNEFDFVPNSLRVSCKKDEGKTIKSLLRFTAWRDNGLGPDDLPSPIFSQNVEGFTVRIQPAGMENAKKGTSSNRVSVNKHGWTKSEYPDRTVWLLSITIAIHPTEAGFSQGVITATSEAIPKESAFLLLSIDAR